jgi:hypothetical protein
MRVLNRLGKITSIAALSAIFTSPAGAVEVTPWGTLVSLQAGWTIDRMLVFHSSPMKNPDGCSLTTNGYIIDENAPGHNLFNTLLLSALLNKREASFVISGCKENRPQIVSVSIR